ncbi:MAG: LysR family transcriptional regulator [Actinomycetia bacterium]|nr:LysR family transcriptional regulator [Actinomycetes bacterium]
MYDLNRLRVLVAVVDEGGFTRAAQALHVAQPAVSQQIKALETQVGYELIDRATKRPTAAGTVLVTHARSAMFELDLAAIEVAELAGLKRGLVRIGAIHWLEPLDLPSLVGGFHARYPGITIRLQEENAADMFAMTLDGDMDLVFSNVIPGDADLPGLNQHRLFVEDLVVATRPGHHLAQGGVCALGDLADEPLIAFRRGSAFHETVVTALLGAGVTPEIAMETSDLAMVRNLVSSGLGVALLPRSLAEAEGRSIGIAEILPHAPARTVALTWNATDTRSAAANAFISFTLKWFGARTGESVKAKSDRLS